MLVDILKPKEPTLHKRDAKNLSLGCSRVLVLDNCHSKGIKIPTVSIQKWSSKIHDVSF